MKRSKSSAGSWADVLVLVGLVGISVAASILWSHEDRFTMIGVFCSLVLGAFGREKSFLSVFLLAGTLILMSYSRLPFNAILFILAADAVISVWYLGSISWFKTRDPADVGILVPIFFSVIMFLIVDIYPVDDHIGTYVMYLFFLVKPLSWTKPKKLSDSESEALESVVSVLSIMAFSHIFHPQPSLEFSLIAMIAGFTLTFLGSGLAAPTLIFLSVAHIVPTWIAFGGLVCFCSLRKGWPLRLLLIALVLGYTLQFKLTEDPLYWAISIFGVFALSVLFVRDLPKLEDLKSEWREVILSLVLLGLPIYLSTDLMKVSEEGFDGTTLGVVVFFALSVGVLLFWKPKFVQGLQHTFAIWEKFVSFIQSGVKEVPVEVSTGYRVESNSGGLISTERTSFQILLWLVIMAVAIIALGSL